MPYITLGARTPGHPWSLHYQTCGPADARITLVCVHELGGSLQSLTQFVELLPVDIRVITFDQRGAGASEHPVESFTVEDLANDLDRLVTELDIHKPFHLMGTAMGAVVALRYAARHSERLRSLVLCDGTGEITSDARRYILDRAAAVRSTGIRPVAQISFSNAFRGLPDPLRDPSWLALRHRFLGNAPLSYALHSEALANEKFTDDEAAAVRCPSLLLTGQHDFIWPPATGKKLSERLPRAQFEEVLEASHFPSVQRPEYVASRVASFVRQHAEANHSFGQVAS